jgi:excisionase family DNA binding protein
MLLRAEEVALQLGLGRTKVFEMLAAGELPVVRIGRNVRVPRRSLEQWVDAQTLAPDRDHLGQL